MGEDVLGDFFSFMRKILILILVAAVTLMAGCHGGGSRIEELNDLADRIEYAPDSALTAIDAALSEATTQRDSDRLIALRAFARYRLYIDDTYQTDSLIAPAADRLYNHADKEDRRFAIIAGIMDSHVGLNSDNRERALRSALRAEDLAQDANFPALPLLMGRIYDSQAYAFLKFHNNRGAYEVEKKAAQWFLIAKDTIRSIEQTLDAAFRMTTLQDTTLFPAAAQIVDSIYNNYYPSFRDFDKMSILYKKMRIAQKKHDDETALQNARELRSVAATMNAPDMQEVSNSLLTSYNIFKRKGMADSAQYYYDKAKQIFESDTTLPQFLVFRQKMANMLYENEDWELAAKEYNAVTNEQLLWINRYGYTSSDHVLVTEMENKHNAQIHSEKVRSMIYLSVAILCLIILATACYIFVRAKCLREKELIDNAMTIRGIEDDFKRLEAESKKKDEELKRKFFEYSESEIEEINRLNAEFDKKFLDNDKVSALSPAQKDVYYELRNTLKTMIESKCEAIISEYSTKHTDSHLNKILSNSETLKLTEENKKLLLMDIIGFRAAVIATILNIEPATIYARKSRLKKRIAEMNILSEKELRELFK